MTDFNRESFGLAAEGAVPHSTSAPTPPGTSPARRFVFSTKIRESDGLKILHFPFMSISDVHWGTMVSRAKRMAHLLHHTATDLLYGLGDMIDFEYLRHKQRWNIGPWHRQGIAHLLRKVAEGIPVLYFRGNHETGMRKIEDDRAGKPGPIWRDGKRSVLGIDLVNDHTRTDPKGRSVHSKHGDVYDYAAMRSVKIKPLIDALEIVLGSREKAEKYVYDACSMAYESLYGIDWGLRQFPPLENYSFAAYFKHFFKERILKNLGVREVIAKALDDSPHDVMIYGHSHMPGFEWTPAGKLLINDGCSTEHVNALVQDEHGTFAILTWHKDGVEVEEEPPAPFAPSVKYVVSWKELGVEHFSKPTPMMDNFYTKQADRLLRLVYKLAPPLERSEIQERQIRHRGLIEKFEEAIERTNYQPRPEEYMAYHRMLADLRYEEKVLARMTRALPRPDLPKTPVSEPARHVA